MGKLKEETRTSEITSAAAIVEQVIRSLDNSAQSTEAWQELKSMLPRNRCWLFRILIFLWHAFDECSYGE